MDEGTVEAGRTAWDRLGQHVEALRAYGIDVHASGAFPPRIFPRGWTDGFAGSLLKISGLIAGAAKRVAQSFTLPRYDTVLVLRDVLIFTGPPFFERLFSERANFLVFELDDAIWLQVEGADPPPLWTPRKTEEAAALADRVIAGNEFLAEWARAYCEDVVVIPTSAGDDIAPRDGEREPGPVRVGWLGHPVGAHFLDTIMPAIASARERTEFDLVIISEPASLGIVRDVPGLHRELIQWEGPESAKHLRDLDIGLMPLDASDFAKGKSAFKLLRYMAAGLPVVVSPVGVNTEVVIHGETGLLATSPEEWAEAVVRLVEDPDLRDAMGKAGRARYEENYSPKAIVPLYAAALTPPLEHRNRRTDSGRSGRRRMGRPRGRGT